MSEFLRRLRRLVVGDDAREAFVSESRAIRAAASPPPLAGPTQPTGTVADNHIVLGTSCADDERVVSIPATEFLGAGHALTLGASGCGKSRLTAHIIVDLIRRIHTGAQDGAMLVLDPKSDLGPLVRQLLAAELDGRPDPRRGLERYVVIDPFDRDRLVPLQLLQPEPGLDPELQALDACSLLAHLSGAELGVKQLLFAYNLFLLGVLGGYSLPDLCTMLADPAGLYESAANCPATAVRDFFGHGGNLTNASLEGVRARLHRLIQVPSLRRMLDASDCLSFSGLLQPGAITIIDTGRAPAGLEDAARAVMGFLVTKLTRAIFARAEVAQHLRSPVSIHVDEWQEVLSAGGQPAAQFERLLSMARSLNVSMHLISQSLAGATKVSPALVEIARTNTVLQIVGRASIGDARMLEGLLPVTGRARRPIPAPWEEASRRPWLSEDEERRMLAGGIPSLPDRRFYAWYRRAHRHAALLRSVDVVTRRVDLPPEVWTLLRHGQAAKPSVDLAPGATPFRRMQRFPVTPGRGRKPGGF